MNIKDKRAAISRLIAEQREIIVSAKKRIAALETQSPDDLLTLESLIPRSEFRRNYESGLKAALDEALHGNAVAGVKHRDKQREKAREAHKAREANKKGYDGGSLPDLVARFARRQGPDMTPGQSWESFRNELVDWSGGDVKDGQRNGKPTYRYTEPESGKSKELTYKRFSALRPKRRT